MMMLTGIVIHPQELDSANGHTKTANVYNVTPYTFATRTIKW